MKRTIILLLLLILPSVCAADDVTVYFNRPVPAPAQQTNLENVVIDLINQAQQTVDVCVYDFELVGIANALVQAKNRQVTVRMITDNDNNKDNAENLAALTILDNNQVNWIDDTADGTKGSDLQHNKFVIIDGKTVLTGSTNFSQSGIHGDLVNGQLINRGNANHLLVIQSTPLATIYTNQFNQMWGDGPGGTTNSKFGLAKADHSLQSVVTDTDNIRIDVQFTPQSPSTFSGSSLENLSTLIDGATTRIYVAQFVFSAQVLADRMQLRQQAGVDIRGVGDGLFFNQYYSEFLDMRGLSKHSPRGDGREEVDSATGHPNNVWTTPADVRVAVLDAGDKFHHKYWVIDDIVVTGSHNASAAAAFKNDENLVVIYDDDVAAQFAAAFQQRFDDAAGGRWESVNFSGPQINVVLDIVNNATMTQLDDDADLRRDAATNIIAARPIRSMDQLADVRFVGKAALTDLKRYIGLWLSHQP